MGNEIEAVIQEYSGWHSESAAGTAADSCRLFAAAYIQLEAPPWYLPVGTLSALSCFILAGMCSGGDSGCIPVDVSKCKSSF